MPEDFLAEYQTELERLLRLPPLREEGSSARRAIRIIYTPSFDPEGSITLVDGPEPALIVRMLLRSAWRALNVRKSPWPSDPPEAWVEPACSEEVLPLPVADRDVIAAVFETSPVEEPPGRVGGIDGMSVRGETWSAGHEVQRFAAWSPRRSGSGAERLSIALVELAMRHARWDASVTGLNAIRRYFRD